MSERIVIEVEDCCNTSLVASETFIVPLVFCCGTGSKTPPQLKLAQSHKASAIEISGGLRNYSHAALNSILYPLYTFNPERPEQRSLSSAPSVLEYQ